MNSLQTSNSPAESAWVAERRWVEASGRATCRSFSSRAWVRVPSAPDLRRTSCIINHMYQVNYKQSWVTYYCNATRWRENLIRRRRCSPQGIQRVTGKRIERGMALNRSLIQTWMVATAFRISIMMMGDTINTRTTIAIPATSLLLASCNVELT